MSRIQGVDSEIGQLRTALMHRPGAELQRITPRHKDRLLFGGLPWVSKARQEHDLLCQELRDQGVEVLYFTELLQDALEYQAARDEAIGIGVADAGLGDELRGQLRAHLEELGPEPLAQVLIAGLTPQEFKIGRGVVFELLDRHDFVLDPLPNLVFTKDSSFWIGDQVAVASLAADHRRRETDLASVIYRHHPMFTGTKSLYEPAFEPVDGGDVLLLAPGVVAVGVGQRTAPAGAEHLARQVFDTGLAHTLLAVPMQQHSGGGHLDTICAVVDIDSVLMHPAVAYTLTAHTITPRPDGMRVSHQQPFLEAAAMAMGIDRLRVIDTGVDPAWGQPGQWNDGGNVLAIGRRLAVSHERNAQTNSRLEEAGVRVLQVPSSELGSLRGGPRCMVCPIGRDPSAQPTDAPTEPELHRPRREQARYHPSRDGNLHRDGRPHRDDGMRRAPELEPASLAAAARSACRPAPEPEEAEHQRDDHQQQREHGQDGEQLDDRHGHQDHDDDTSDEQQHTKHGYTLRPAVPGRHTCPAARPIGLSPRAGSAPRNSRNAELLV
ncbi:MAG: arginine deiminase [Streptosporangiaceae bacterium]